MAKVYLIPFAANNSSSNNISSISISRSLPIFDRAETS